MEPQAFFQTNTAQTETLYDAAIAAAQKLAPHDATVWDLYCGCGTITAALASKFQHVVGIEAVPESVISATKNAARNRLDNVSFLQGDALEIFAHTTEKPSLIVVDPPRAGMNRPVVDALANLGAPIVYVSCNPKTLARDLALLCGFGYSITSVQPIDMFPHTAHVETVVALNAPNHTNN